MTVSVLSRLAETLIQSSLLIAAVLLLRAASGERLEKRLRYYLWLPVILRLLLPFSVGSRFSVMNLLPTAAHIGTAETSVLSGASAFAEASAMSAAQPVDRTLSASFPWRTVMLCVWLTGAAAVGLLALRGNARFYRRLKDGRQKAGIGIMPGLCARMGIKRVPAVYISDKITSPCAVGVFRPAVYLPPWAVSDTGQLRYILMHELTHIKRQDNLLALLISVCCAVYWFDPLVWLMAHYARRDRELACDAWVTGGMGQSEKTAYGMALVSAVRMQSGRRTRICAASFASRGNEMLDRIKAIKSGRPAAKWLALSVCAAMACAVVFFGTSAKTLTADGGITKGLPDAGGENIGAAYIYPDADGYVLSFFDPVLLGKAVRCDDETSKLLQENFRISGSWMEIEPYAVSDGSYDIYSDLLNKVGTGTEIPEHQRRVYKVVEQTSVGQGNYIIGINELRRLGDRLYTSIH